MTRAVARSVHEIPERPPLHLVIGERVSVERRETEWPAFVYVTATAGEGWVPSRHLSGDTGTVAVLAPYSTTELPTRSGETLTVVERDRPSEWSWCTNRHGRAGWVPDRTLEFVDEEPPT